MPGREFQQWIVEEFGKDPSRYEYATYPQEALEELSEYVGNLPVLGQDFFNNDLYMINEHREVLHMDRWDPISIQDLRDWSGGKSLEKVAYALGMDYGNGHDALEDACLTMKAYEHYKDAGPF